MDETPILRVVLQRHEMDCGVACLAMWTGVSYEAALMAMAEESPSVLNAGVWMQQMCTAASRLKHPLRVRRRFDLETDSGILKVRLPRARHLVILKAGLIIDTDGTLWDADVYMKSHRAKATALLVPAE